jgi:secreted trypsin-like serine protease
MLARATRWLGALAGAVALIAAVAAPTAIAKAPQARASVVGGTPASLTDWGFTAAVTTPHTLCTGSVISPTKVLTAAHCTASPAIMAVRTNSTLAFAGGDVHPVTQVAINPGWNHGFIGDVAVLTLGSPTSAPPIQLADPSADSAVTGPGARVLVAGFGARNPAPRRKPRIGVLTAAEVFVHGFCPVPTSLLCDAGKRSGLIAIRKIKGKTLRRPVQRTVCSGDSGGPMVASTPFGPLQVGIAEATAAPPKHSPFGFVWCGLKGFPGLHTRVASWLSFIQSG